MPRIIKVKPPDWQSTLIALIITGSLSLTFLFSSGHSAVAAPWKQIEASKPSLINGFHLTSDFNYDWKIDLIDLADFFIYLATYTDTVPKDFTFRIADTNDGGTLDSLDTVSFLRYIISPISPYDYGLTLAPPDSLPDMNDQVKDYARRHLAFVEEVHPEWRNQINAVRRQLGLTPLEPVPVRPDLNGDGTINILDIALFFAYLGDSLGVLPADHPIIRGMDYNVDGKVDPFDTEAFWGNIVNYDTWTDVIGMPAHIFLPTANGHVVPSLSEKSRALTIRLLAWMYTSGEPYVFSDGYTWVQGRIYQTGLSLDLLDFRLNPVPPPSDMNLDFSRDLADALLFFGYFSDSLTILPETHPVISRMDFNFDSRIDTLDIEKFLFFLFYNNHPQAQSHPRALPADSLPRISPAAKKLALDWLAKLEPLHRDWPVWVDYYTLESKVAELRELVLTVRTTRPTVCDYNGDGHVNVLDLVVMLIGGINGDPLSDRDGDGVFRINDLVLFLNYMRSGRCP